jgi:sarcosine oxidase subunit alpha
MSAPGDGRRVPATSARGDGYRVPGPDRGTPFDLSVDGEAVRAYPGETVAAALLAAGRRAFRRTGLSGEPRGLYCGMGVCGECAVTVDGEPGVRACVAIALPGMAVSGLPR